MPAPRIAVLGLGNVLLGDDAVGPLVVELLMAGWEVPDSVELVDVGTPGLGLLVYVHGADVVILVDAVAADGEPGSVRIYRDGALSEIPTGPRVSPHDPALLEVLGLAALDGAAPRAVVLVGVVPESVELGAVMSDRVRAGAVLAAGVVVDELRRHAAVPVPRRACGALEVWWERAPRAAWPPRSGADAGDDVPIR